MTAGSAQNRRSTSKVQALQERQHGGPLTKADTVALWHAVEAQSDMFRATRALHAEEGKFTPELIEAERQRLLASRRALRKVNQLRKEGR